MPDVALSTAASSTLAALLSGASVDSKAAKSGDPFAALLAHAGGKSAATTKTGTNEAVAALLAGTAAPAPVLPTATPATPIAPEVTAETLSADAEIAAPEGKSEDSDESKDDSDDKDGGDKLADAIASGATAVLALAPVIVAPVQPTTTPATPVQVKIDGPIAPKPLKLAQTSIPAAFRRQPGDGADKSQTAESTTQIQAGSTNAQPQMPQPAATIDAKPAAEPLSPEVTKAVTTGLPQPDAPAITTTTATAAQTQPQPQMAQPVQAEPKSTAPQVAAVEASNATATVAKPADAAPTMPIPGPALAPTTPVAAAAAKLQHLQRSPAPHQSAAPQAQAAATAPAAQPPRRDDEPAAPRRSGEARRRTDTAAIDPASAGITQNGPGNVQATVSRPVGAVQDKGDTMVEQTLTIAKDGAWLDSLAKDIVNAGSGNDLHFKLAPENLGALSVSISHKDDGASIRLTADNQQTRDILVDAQPKLIAEARAQGLKVSDAQVDVKQDQNQSQNQSSNQDTQRWAQQQTGQQSAFQQEQNRQSSPGHKPFVSNLAPKAEAESESSDGDSDGLYA